MRMGCHATFLLAAGVLMVATLPHSLRAADVESVIEHVVPDPDVQVRRVDRGLAVTCKTIDGGMVRTKAKYETPLIITAVASTNSTNIRLGYGPRGRLILDWELNLNELRHHDPKTGRESGRPGQGFVPKNTWATIRWEIDEDRSRVFVDGVERASFAGDYADFSGTVGIGTARGAVVTVKSLTVESLKVSRPTSPAVPRESSPDDGKPLDIAVSVMQPATQAADESAAATTRPAGPDSIERPWYQSHPKRLQRDLTSLTAMMVRIAEDGEAVGFTSDIIATVRPDSRSGTTAGVGFVRADGDAAMKAAFEEAVRAVRMRYPIWEPGHIDISFGEKFDAHGGPSAGTAFALLMLSSLEGFELDPKCAVTGDVTVDWKVRPVGAVVAKLRGASLDHCKCAVIPEDNRTSFTDMAVIYGDQAFTDLQVFTVERLQQAVAISRADRSANIAEAIALFAEVQQELKPSSKLPIAARNAKIHDQLERILKLAPNHLSAKTLLGRLNGTVPKTLSANATIYQLSVLFYPYRMILNRGEHLDRNSLPPYITTLARKRLAALRPIANPDLRPAVNDVAAFIEAADAFAGGRGSATTVIDRGRAVDQRFAELDADPKFIEKLIREGY